MTATWSHTQEKSSLQDLDAMIAQLDSECKFRSKAGVCVRVLRGCTGLAFHPLSLRKRAGVRVPPPSGDALPPHPNLLPEREESGSETSSQNGDAHPQDRCSVLQEECVGRTGGRRRRRDRTSGSSPTMSCGRR